MGPGLTFVVYLTLWWIVFLAILPMGTVSHAEAGVDRGDGGDPGAPIEPKIWRKARTATWVAVIPLAIIWLTVFFHLITLPSLTGAAGPAIG
jgi:predicted secreted protein